ncbi:MAG: 4-(cytidine 5'-diphospho)-2-C-methyl-D-erythritol kinase [Acidobacteriota bacterium]
MARAGAHSENSGDAGLDAPSQLEVPSFAKINWFLRIEGRRRDGYHQITTVFQTVDLVDRIRFRVTEDTAIHLEVAGREVAGGEDNLLYRAVASVQERAGVRRGLHISLAKRIPVGGGLGGGSSNAAVGLLAADRLWRTNLGTDQLMELAAWLGADVPFFLEGGTALGTGRGDHLFPLPDFPQTQLLILLYPGFPVSTRDAYQARDWGEYRGDPVLTTIEAEHKIHRFREAIARVDLSWLENDFEQIVFELYPTLAQGSRQLMAAGCRPVLLSGSGSCLFGVVDADKAEKAAREVARQTAGEVFLCHSLSRQEYKRRFAIAGLEL